MRYRPLDSRDLPKDVFEKRARNNPYFAEIYNYPDLILPNPTPERFQAIWADKCLPDTKVHVEIGCGSGKYLLHWSQTFPDQCFVGFELRYKRLVLAAKKIQNQGGRNVLLLKDKGEYINDYFGENSIDRVHVNFPDPWSKKAQRKHRLLGDTFFQTMEPLFRPEGQLLFKTDHHEYFQSVQKLLQEFPQYDIIEQTVDLHNSPYHDVHQETEFEGLFKSKANPPIGYMKVQIRKG